MNIVLLIIFIIAFIIVAIYLNTTNIISDNTNTTEGFWSWNYWYDPHSLTTTPCEENIFEKNSLRNLWNPHQFIYYPQYATPYRKYRRIYSYF